MAAKALKRPSMNTPIMKSPVAINQIRARINNPITQKTKSEIPVQIGMRQGCSSSSICFYGNTTYSIGYLSKETSTLTSSGVFQGYLFGCGQRNNLITDGGAAGILGLGRGWFSLVSQTANTYHKVFSYCLPSKAGSNGYLNFGDANLPCSIKFTPMSDSFDGTRYYGLDMFDISIDSARSLTRRL
ncbi:Peptidase A1 [Corchorus capsularis]|uniref:Peptidase A1 n=1 Tax=Corchorus capsularis TaxID=210143 RepID=A0A1R3HWF6_COCAP|nr:Peptidase A1 [Corchorus capsularis]